MSMLLPPAAISASLDAAPANARDHGTSLAREEHEKSDRGHSCEHTRPRGPLEEEARFFDRWADCLDESKLPIDPLAWKRYTSPRLRPRFNKEFRFLLLGDLRRKTLLDVGCGDSVNVALSPRWEPK